jgi:hypothetical protein
MIYCIQEVLFIYSPILRLLLLFICHGFNHNIKDHFLHLLYNINFNLSQTCVYTPPEVHKQSN